MAATTGADFTEPPPNVFYFRDPKPVADPIVEAGKSPGGCPGQVPLVVDNGSFQCRAGWALDQKPRLQFKNVSARSRGASRSDTQVGNDIRNLEVVRWLLKSQFDRNVVVNFDIQEQVFDYIFQHLGITSEVRVHPGEGRGSPQSTTLLNALTCQREIKKQVCKEISVICKNNRVVMVGDFNFPNMHWDCHSDEGLDEEEF
eukprot:g43866.t1